MAFTINFCPSAVWGLWLWGFMLADTRRRLSIRRARRRSKNNTSCRPPLPDKTGMNPANTDSDVKLNSWEKWKYSIVVFLSSLQNIGPSFPSSCSAALFQLFTKQRLARPSLIQEELGSRPLNKVPEVFQGWWRALWRLSSSGVPNSQGLQPTARYLGRNSTNRVSICQKT